MDRCQVLERIDAMNVETEEVVCTECGTVDRVPVGHLTEVGKKNYKCRVHMQKVVEKQVEEANIGKRQVLVD